MGSPEPRETVNLATRYDEELMPWSRALEALGTGSMGPDVACRLQVRTAFGVGLRKPHGASRWSF
jgi:hypothetical protein